MNLPAAVTVLEHRHHAFADRRRRLKLAGGLPLTPELTWPAFWDQVNRILRSCGYRRSTRRQYRHVLRALRIHGVCRPAELTADRSRDFIHRVAATGASWSWIGLNIAVLRTVFDRLCGLAITRGLVTPKRGFRLPETLSENEATRLVQAGSTIRDQLLLGLLYGCGLTACEACALRWQDVEDSGTHLHIAATTRYMERVLPAPEPFRELLQLGTETCAPDDYIFRGRPEGAALSRRMVRIIVRRACRRAGIGRPICAMSLRHSYAVRRLENGVNLRQLQHELGHASIRTTERYQHCLAPQVPSHPFSKVRALTAQYGQKTPGPAIASSPQPSGFSPQPSNAPPLAGLKTIDLRRLRLPLDQAGRTAAQRFMGFLKNRLFGSLFKRTAIRAP